MSPLPSGPGSPRLDTSPPTETPEVATPSARTNQDPGIPNIDVGGYEGDSSKYQSGMTVSTSQRANQDEHEPSLDWSSPVSQQQRDLARMLGQSSAKILHRPSSPDNQVEAEPGSPAVSDIAKRLEDLRDFGGDGEGERRERSEEAGPSDASSRGKSSSRPGLIGRDSEQTIRIDGRSIPDTNLSPSGEAIQTIPLTAPHDDPSQASDPVPQANGSIPPSPKSQAQKAFVSDPSSPETKHHSTMSHKESHPAAYKASLPQLLEEEGSEKAASIFTNKEPFVSAETKREPPKDNASLKPSDQPSRFSPGRNRLNSELSEDAQRYDVGARQRAEALRLKAVWEEKGHLTAPKQSPNDVHRRLKAM